MKGITIMVRFKKLNQRGFDHVVTLVAFVALFGLAGISFVYFSRAAVPSYELRSGITDSGTLYCLNAEGTSTGSGIDAAKCNGQTPQGYTFDWTNGEIKINGGCLSVQGASSTKGFTQTPVVLSTSCKSTPWGGAWTPDGSTAGGYTFLNRHADSSPINKKIHYCLDLTAGKSVDINRCSGGTNQEWFYQQYGAAPSSGKTTPPPSPAPAPTVKNYSYSLSTTYTSSVCQVVRVDAVETASLASVYKTKYPNCFNANAQPLSAFCVSYDKLVIASDTTSLGASQIEQSYPYCFPSVPTSSFCKNIQNESTADGKSGRVSAASALQKAYPYCF